MTTKSPYLLLVILFAEELIFQDVHSSVLYQVAAVNPLLPVFHVADFKSIFDTDKPDPELGTNFIKLGNEMQPFIPRGRALVRRMSAQLNKLEEIYPRVLDMGLRLQDGRTNPAFRTAFSEEIRKLSEDGELIANEMKKFAEDAPVVIDKFKQISEELKKDLNKDVKKE